MAAGGDVSNKAGGPLVVMAAGGPITDAEAALLRAASEVADIRFGVDSGTRHFLQVEQLPHLVSGDFDSLNEDELLWLEGQDIRVLPTPDQDYTDLDKALTIALDELGAGQVRIFAATGGRLDHIYSVLSTLVKYGRRADVRLVDEVGETWLVNGTITLTGVDLPGRTLSLMALGVVEGITTTGVVWPLSNESLAPGIRDGTLNQIAEESVQITVGTGDLLVMLHHA